MALGACISGQRDGGDKISEFIGSQAVPARPFGGGTFEGG
jgi:hypothetical protein